MIETTTPATGPGQRLLDRIADIAIYGAVAALLGWWWCRAGRCSRAT